MFVSLEPEASRLSSSTSSSSSSLASSSSSSSTSSSSSSLASSAATQQPPKQRAPLMQNTAGPPLLRSAAPLSLACLRPLTVQQRREQTIAVLREQEATLTKRLTNVRRLLEEFTEQCPLQRPQPRKPNRAQLCSQSNLMNTQKKPLAWSGMDPLQLPPAPAWATERNSRIIARQRRQLRIRRRLVPRREKRPHGNSDFPGTPEPRRLPCQTQITTGSSRSRKILDAAINAPQVEEKAKDEKNNNTKPTIINLLCGHN